MTAVTPTAPERPTTVATARRWFAPLDGLRAVGALAVLTTHVGFASGAAVSGWSAPLLARLDIGVALFFVLSGFLLYRPHALASLGGGPRPVTREYLWHRALRIIPACWLAILLAALLSQNRELPWTSWAANATLTQIYASTPPMQGLTQLWSLAVEVSYYLVLPGLALLAVGRRQQERSRALRRHAVVIGGAVAVSAAFVVLTHDAVLPYQWSSWLPAYLDWFAVGMGIAVAHAAVTTGAPGPWTSLATDLSRSPGTTWALAGLVFVLAMTPLAGPYTLSAAGGFEALAKNLLYAVVAGALLLPCAFAATENGTGPVRLLTTRPLRWLGRISYGVFLYHLVVLELVRQVTGHVVFSGGFWTLLALTVVVTLPLAALSFRYVEAPIVRWGRRRWTSSATTGTSTAAPTPSSTSS